MRIIIIKKRMGHTPLCVLCYFDVNQSQQKHVTNSGSDSPRIQDQLTHWQCSLLTAPQNKQVECVERDRESNGHCAMRMRMRFNQQNQS